MKKLRIFLLILAFLAVLYLLGPNPSTPQYDTQLLELPADPGALEQAIAAEERRHPVKRENEARIVWNDTVTKSKTDWAVVYLHGFSASQEEGDPVHTDFARHFGCNLYLARLAAHGLDTPDAMIQLTADDYWASAKNALAVGRQLGRKLILMGTSTGGTNALQLAYTYPDLVDALILLSPNIAINDPNAGLLNNPWGLQIARLVKGSNFIESQDQRDIYKKYWYSRYRLEGAVALQEMIETTMKPAHFQKIRQPLLLMYYYKDEVHQDSTVKVSAMREMFQQLGTPAEQKWERPIPGAGNHVIGSYIKSGDLGSVREGSFRFASDVLRMLPAASIDSSF